MRKLLFTALLSLGVFFVYSQSVVGVWKTVSDVDGKPSGKVEIYESNGKYYAKIVDIFDPAKKNLRCTECKGNLKNQKRMGLVFLRDFVKESKTKYVDGTIVDPDNGKEYSSYLELVTPNKLKVRGYIGVSLIGRTQYWYRVVEK